MAPKLDTAQMQRYWTKTSRLMWTILALWFFFSFVVPLFAVQLNKIVDSSASRSASTWRPRAR